MKDGGGGRAGWKSKEVQSWWTLAQENVKSARSVVRGQDKSLDNGGRRCEAVVIEMQARRGWNLSLNGRQATRVEARNSSGSTTIRIFRAFVSDVTDGIYVFIIVLDFE